MTENPLAVAKESDVVLKAESEDNQYKCDTSQIGVGNITEKKIRCYICRKECKTMEEKYLHTEEEHGIKNSKKYTEEFKIDAVKKVKEIGLTNAAKEIQVDSNTLYRWGRIIFKPLYCSICGKAFDLENRLKTHEKRHHPTGDLNTPKPFKEKKEHQCEKCSKLFISFSRLKRHLQNCSGFKVKSSLIQDIFCTICNKNFCSKKAKEEHIRFVHEKERNFFCEFCSKGFATKNHLTEHIKAVHEKIRNFGCGFCEKKFFKNKDRTIHERKHTGEKPFKCENCGQACSRYKAKKAEYKCDKCKAALVQVIFQTSITDKSVECKDDEHQGKDITKIKEKKTHPINPDLRELYIQKYTADGDVPVDGDSMEIIKDELLEVELKDADDEEIVDHNCIVSNDKESNFEELIDDDNFVQSIKESNFEEVVNDFHLVRKMKESNNEMNEETHEAFIDDHPPEDVKQSNNKDVIDNLGVDNSPLVHQVIKTEYCEIKNKFVKDGLESSEVKESEEKTTRENEETRTLDKNYTKNEIKDEIKLELSDTLEEHEGIKNSECKREVDANIAEESHKSSLLTISDNTCNICQKKFSTKKGKNEHIRFLHEKEKNFYCAFCRKGFATKNRTTEHIKAVHEKIRNFDCGFCEKKFFKKREKIIHERNHTGEKPYRCQICGESFKQKLTMNEHASFHLGVKEFQCVECGKQFGYQRSLHHHLVQNHNHEFPCKMCDKKFNQKSNLQRHMNHHLGIKHFQCVDCGKQYSSSRSLKQHVDFDHLQNQREISTCSTCGKVFKHENNMKTHMKTHLEGNVKVQCAECGKHYASARILKDHVANKHEGKSKFKCQVCDKAFGREKVLEVHKSTHLKPHQCKICSQGYNHQSYLMKHIDKEHPYYNSK